MYEKTWPEHLAIRDSNPQFGNADFSNINALNIDNYVPQNKNLVKNQGIQIEKIPNDSIGLIYDLQVEKDIMGNPIQGKPDIGAIEML